MVVFGTAAESEKEEVGLTYFPYSLVFLPTRQRGNSRKSLQRTYPASYPLFTHLRSRICFYHLPKWYYLFTYQEDTYPKVGTYPCFFSFSYQCPGKKSRHIFGVLLTFSQSAFGLFLVKLLFEQILKNINAFRLAYLKDD